MNQQVSARVSELEWRVALLTNVAIIQMFVLAYLLQLLMPAIITILALLPILALTHKRLPALAKKCGRWFSFVSDVPKNSTPKADGEPAV